MGLGYLTRVECTESEARNLLRQLHDHGLLVKMSGRSKLRVVLNKSDEARERVEKLFFDPRFGIAHHVRISDCLFLRSKVILQYGSWMR